MAALASHRYATADSYSSSSPSSSSPSSSSGSKKKSKNAASAFRRLISNTTAAAAPDSSSRALVKARSGTARAPASAGQNLSGLVKKFIENRSQPKPRGANRTEATATLIVPHDLIAADLKKAKGSNISALSRKLFQKSGSSGKTAPALTEVRTNTRTLAMVLRSERELLAQNEDYEGRVSELLLLVEAKDREIDKLKDLCLKQREEIKALKDAILFPDAMNSQLQKLLEEQGSELKQAKHVIPSLQKQVTSLTKQLECLTESLAEVKAEKYAANQSFDGNISSTTTPITMEAANSLDHISGGPSASGYDSPDEMFTKDLNPCLTPCFQKAKSQEHYEFGCELSKVELFERIAFSRTDAF